MTTMDEITDLLLALPGVRCMEASEELGSPEVAWGDRFFTYHPDGGDPNAQPFPFATIVRGDYPDDTSSQLDRDGVFRVNLHLDPATWTAQFPDMDADFDHAAFDRWFPHPVYARQRWASIVNPGEESADDVRRLIDASHAHATRYDDQRG